MTQDTRAGGSPAQSQKSFWGRHPRFSILLIAGVFYAILIGMCSFVFVLVLLG
jgi:hypothetical protein